MASDNGILDALLFLGYGQLKNGLIRDAIDTFSAAHLLDTNDDRALRARELAYGHLNQPGSAIAFPNDVL